MSLAVPLHSTNADGLYLQGITLLPDYVYTVTGGGQSAEVGSPYPSPLVVTVTDPSVLDGDGQPSPVLGVLVSFENLNQAGLNFGNSFGEALTDAQGNAVGTGRANYHDGPIDVEALAFGYLVGTFFGTNLAFPPTFTSTSSATFALGQANSFMVTTSSTPQSNYQETGTLPVGVTFVDNFNGTATLAGTPGPGTDGTYPIAIEAYTYTGDFHFTTQNFVLTVGEPATILGPFSTTFDVGQAGMVTVKTSGSPTPTLTEVPALPQGVTFIDNGDGTATFAGTPESFTSGDYPLTITASNGIGAPDFEPFDLTVYDPPVVTISAPSEPFAVVGDSVVYTIDFTDDYLLDSSLAAGDVQLVSPTGDAAAQIDVAGPNSITQGVEYVATLSGFSGDGPIGISIPAGVASNSLGEQSPAASGASFFVETMPPTIVASPSNPEPSEGGTVT